MAAKAVLRLPRKVLFYYIILLVGCVFVTTIILGVCYLGPSISTSRRVIETSGVKVDQFYSGVLLSALFALIGLLIKKTGEEIALRHPFDIAYTSPIRVTDLDAISAPGPLALLPLCRLSKWRAAVQLTLMLAAWLSVPLGTLIVTTGSYISSTPGRALVPMNTVQGAVAPLRSLMNLSHISDAPSGAARFDGISQLMAQVFDGNLLGGSELVNNIPPELGVRPQLSTSFLQDVTYKSIVSWYWSADCRDAGEDMAYTIEQIDINQRNIMLTTPDNATTPILLDRRLANQSGITLEWHDPTLPVDKVKYNYYLTATLADTPQTASYASQIKSLGLPPGDAPSLDQGVWISRVRCETTLEWRTADCRWDGHYMRNCTAAEPLNNTALDTTALNSLKYYMYIVPWNMFGPNGTSIFKWDAWPGIVPSVRGHHALQGLLALSLATVASMTTWGTAEVPTIGEPMREVYIVRIYILVIVFLMLLLVTTVAIADVAYSLFHGLPARKVGFLSIANATRGAWWDQLLDTSSEKPLKSERRYIGRTKVMLGVPDGDQRSLMLGPEVGRGSMDERSGLEVVEMYERLKSCSSTFCC